MADYHREMELVKLATHNAGQLHEWTTEIEQALRGDPGGAREFLRPCSVLLQRLLEGQAAVEALLEKLFAASALETVERR